MYQYHEDENNNDCEEAHLGLGFRNNGYLSRWHGSGYPVPMLRL